MEFFATGSNYFRVVGADTISGRDFNDGDEATGSRVAIVNQSFVEKFWPGEEPIGKRLRATTRGQPGEWRTVVGVVSNIMQRRRPAAVQAAGLRAIPAATGAAAFFLARTRVPPNQVAQVVRAEVERLDPDVILTDFRTLKAASPSTATSWMPSTASWESTRPSRQSSPESRCCSLRSGSKPSSRTRSASARRKSACGWRSALRLRTSAP